MAALIARKEVSSFDVIYDTLDRIDRISRGLNAFVALRAEAVLAEAVAKAEKIASGKI